MGLPLIYRPVQPAECRQVAELHRQVFPPEHTALTVFASPCVDQYLASLIAYPHYQVEHHLVGAWHDSRLVAYAHFRAVAQAWHLNNIAVSADHQGQAIGRVLWEQFVSAGRQRGYKAMSLDVVAGNDRAAAWYQRRGLSVVRTTWWYESELAPGPVPPGAIQLLDWEAAQAWQSAYGFSSFRLVGQDAVWTIGRLGEHYFRCAQPCSAEVQAVLAELDPARRLLVAAEQPMADATRREVGVSQRMEGQL